MTVSGLTVESATWVSYTEFDLVVSVPSNASARQSVTYSAADGGSATRAFTVNARPRPTSSSPAAPHGTTTSITITGTHFMAGSAVSTIASGISFGTPTSITSNSITVPVTVASTKPAGPYTLTVTNPDGGSGSARVLQVT